MEDIILTLEPVFHRVEKFLLWHNRYASLFAFIFGHGIFYAIARAGLRPFCAITLVLFIIHILDCIRKKRLNDEEKNLSELTKLILRLYQYICHTHEKLNIIKTENRAKYSIIIIIISLILAYIGMKINGYYISYVVMLILFTLPAIVYHKLISKLLKRLAPILEQLDESMEYKRRTLIDRKDLLVKIKTPGLNENDDDDDDDEDFRKLKQKQQIQTKDHLSIINDDNDDDDDDDDDDNNNDNDDESSEQNLISTSNEYETSYISQLSKQTNPSASNFDILNDSSSSIADDETSRINELYANVGDKIDGKQRIKIKDNEIKIKGYSNKQRSRMPDANFFRSNNINIKNASGEPDLTGFDFLNDYDE
ncbi:unnamed protein product [Rotaria sp. Silwood1]|nr:unnamed protein product [Rotaria sp. Silwood1]CAF3559460.1 unnamed protein product [Rotaria sp. Silwood1]CAF3570251.1 unnamed protein product [Rotaria sp. Silwood1]CAF4649302.1 unnamed protein product [Rotaria sp. Silwood1]CAF4847065.1 unnamed protein product [Rotaria sp. Silwood1]